jgi:putative transposase
MGKVATQIERCSRAFSEKKKYEVVELNVQVDHIHLLATVPPKISTSDYVGILKGRTASKVFNKFK